jgi:hypothetical protein
MGNSLVSSREPTPQMIAAAARCLRAHLREDGISHSESELIGEKVLRAALLVSPSSPHLPSEVA